MNKFDIYLHKIKKFDAYPEKEIYSPSKKYPEYIFSQLSSEKNLVYEGVRNLFLEMGLDQKNVGLSRWNPLGEIIKPGNKVVLKPNFVMDKNPIDPSLYSLVTHPSVIRVVLDYVLLALMGKGEIVIGDASLQNCDYDNLKKVLSFDSLISFYEIKTPKNLKVPISFKDFRYEKAIVSKKNASILRYKKVNPLSNFVSVDLKKESFLSPIEDQSKQFRVSNYNSQEMQKHHFPGKHEYLIHKDVLKADVFINLPKLKIHKKAGITCCLKNIVGINGHKDWLPHFRTGCPQTGGDNYPKKSFLKLITEKIIDVEFAQKNYFARYIFKIPKQVLFFTFQKILEDPIFDGSWKGNDTLWRTILDLNRILLYSDKKGVLKKLRTRKIFNLVDGLIVGENNSPLEPAPYNLGIIFGGVNSLYLDAFSAKIMNFKINDILYLKKGFSDRKKFKINFQEKDFSQVLVCENKKAKNISKVNPYFLPKLPIGWKS